jgi:hypothetical protein
MTGVRSGPRRLRSCFILHAAMNWGADQRKELEHLCRYITRPAIANERLKRNRAGRVVLQLKSPYKDGTHPYRHGAAGVHGAPSCPGAAAAFTSDPLSRRSGTQHEVA